MSIVVVTGAAGYIGGQCALQLYDQGHRVIGIDRRPLPRHLDGIMDFVQADFDSDQSYMKIIQTRPDAIIHCAGTSLVGPSMTKPSDYYHNNVVKTLNLLNIVLSAMPKTRFIFSSSASVYGTPVLTPCHEVDPRDPISPYGESKMMIEQVLASYNRAYNLDYVSFRYFNACGADPRGRHGQEPDATHLIARILEATRDNKTFKIYGVDYPTVDGTCVRDYVHVDDIARAHVLALSKDIPAGIYNLGSNQGTTVKQVVERAIAITGKTPTIEFGAAREGDPAQLTASADKINALVQWQQYNLDDMIQHAWNWYVRKNKTV